MALLREAKLLALVSISSLKALDTVNLSSLFFDPVFPFVSFWISSPLSLLVARCSASLRFSKLLVIGKADFEKVEDLGVEGSFLLKLAIYCGLDPVALLNHPLLENLHVFFSI